MNEEMNEDEKEKCNRLTELIEILKNSNSNHHISYLELLEIKSISDELSININIEKINELINIEFINNIIKKKLNYNEKMD